MINIIAAIQEKDRGIGSKNELLFRISEDLKRFKALTTGHPIIMGRKTFESFGAKPLPNRTNIVISKTLDAVRHDIVVVRSLEEALNEAQVVDDEVFIIGGGEIYRDALPFTQRLYLTVAKSDVSPDTFFPDYSAFTKVISEEKKTDEKSGISFTYLTLQK